LIHCFFYQPFCLVVWKLYDHGHTSGKSIPVVANTTVLPALRM
jgi:hypothetical protein